MAEEKKLTQGELEAQELVEMVESGPRKPKGRFASGFIVVLCFLWSLFQLFYAQSPSGFEFNIGNFEATHHGSDH